MSSIQVWLYIFLICVLVVVITMISNLIFCFRSSDCDIDLVPLDTFIQESSISTEDSVC